MGLRLYFCKYRMFSIRMTISATLSQLFRIDDHLGVSRDFLLSGLLACLDQFLFLNHLPLASVLWSNFDLQQH